MGAYLRTCEWYQVFSSVFKCCSSVSNCFKGSVFNVIILWRRYTVGGFATHDDAVDAIELLEASSVAASSATDTVSGVASTFGLPGAGCSLDVFDRAQYEITGDNMNGGTISISVSCGSGYVMFSCFWLMSFFCQVC